MNEKELIEGLMKSDDKAFDKLIDLYGNDILRLCYLRTSSVEVAEDLTQETLIAIFKYIGNFKGKSSLKTWIYKIAINNCNKFLKNKIKDNITYVDFNDKNNEILEDEDFTEELLKIVDKNIILEGLSNLDNKYREVIYMFYYEEISIKEIGEILEKNENTIKTLLRRGREGLKKILNREDLYA
ncbi:MAG: RNA polymerase sigma factor [Sarcina sp.]